LRLKWVALFSAVIMGVSLALGDWGARAAMVASFSNYLLFFGPTFLRQISTNRQTAARRTKFKVASYRADTLHRCEVCSRTEVSNPELDFRVSADGHEYCTAHLPARNTPAQRR
ncbi:MAG: hypothetical protein PHC88_13325, partial [Terrimicrobiaceae bacterium]|nr:hypothetical protein [Terrimicrobiaceae bacterium]